MPTLGVIADTHVPQRLPRLPAGLDRAFRGVELILHAGDLNRLSVLRELERIAPTVAVAGNADLFHTGLPARRVVEIDGKRIGLTHGHGSWPHYLIRKLKEHLRFKYDGNSYIRAVRAAFAHEPIDAIVFGHTHRCYQQTVDGRLIFNPGPVAPRYYNTPGPQVGLLHVRATGLRAEVIEL
ncbi:MAG TPA: metallophosphoesterase family protein [Anaerolineae bacterium]|nr:metallophosphoesterase family protein [Anaerolineae bacterium]